MFEQEVSSLLDIVAYIEDEELRESLEKVIPSTARSIEQTRKRNAEEAKKDSDGICKFIEAWRGRCTHHAWAGADVQMCKPHFEQKCRVCGAQAVLTCPETFQFVCGTPVCKNHTNCYRGRH